MIFLGWDACVCLGCVFTFYYGKSLLDQHLGNIFYFSNHRTVSRSKDGMLVDLFSFVF